MPLISPSGSLFMKKLLAIVLLIAGTLYAEYQTCGYENSVVDYMNFADSLIVRNEAIRSEVLVKIPNEDGEVIESNFVDFDLQYRYEAEENRVYLEGRGDLVTIDLDEQKRPVKMVKGNVRTTTFQYYENETIIEEYPNTTDMTRHTVRFTYKFNDAGDTTMIIRTPTDWEYGQTPEWAPAHADTVAYSYDADGRKLGIHHVLWTIDHGHSFPWQRSVDSLDFTYEADGDNTIETITQISQVGDSWVTMREDTQYVSIINSDGQVLSSTVTRWDAQNREWDKQYYTKHTYTYKGKYLHNKTVNIHYGDGTKTLLVHEKQLAYKRNNLKYGDPATSIGDLTSGLNSTPSRFVLGGGNRLSFTGAVSSIDKISVYSVQGRLLRSVSGVAELSLDGISQGQALFVVATKGSEIVLTSKMIIQ